MQLYEICGAFFAGSGRCQPRYWWNIGVREDEVISGLGSGLIIGVALAAVLGSILYLATRHE